MSEHSLDDELARTRERMDRLAQEYEELAANPDVIQEDRDAARQLLEEARGEVAALERARSRTEHGDYGRCVKCSRPIPAERLEALPDAETCVDCAR